jgi:hypothetical protein
MDWSNRLRWRYASSDWKTKVMVDSLKPVSKLRMLLAEIESELGLTALSSSERDLLYALVSESADTGSVVTTNALRANPIVEYMSDPTMYRYIIKLIEKGVIMLAPGRQRGAYMVVAEFFHPKH